MIFIGLILFSASFGSAYSDDLIVLGNGHAPIYTSNSDSGRFDFGNDGKADYFVKAQYTGNENQKYKLITRFKTYVLMVTLILMQS